jgi:hypothetical protein
LREMARMQREKQGLENFNNEVGTKVEEKEN